MKKEKKEAKKLKEGDEVIFVLSGRPITEKVTVESIDKKGGFAMLSNRVKVARTLGPDNTYPRLDGQKGMFFLSQKNMRKPTLHIRLISRLRET